MFLPVPAHSFQANSLHHRPASPPPFFTEKPKDRFLRFGATVGLTAQESEALNALNQQRPIIPENLIIFTDPNKDPDDVATLAMASHLARTGHIQLQAVISTLGDESVRTQRAQFAKGILNSFGLTDVPVAVGSEYPRDEQQKKEHAKFLDIEDSSLLGDASTVRKDTPTLLKNTLSAAPNKSVTLLVIAGMTDPMQLLKSHPGLFKQKVKQVVIMGGINPDRAPDGLREADDRAYNNLTDLDAAKNFYRGVQELGIPLTVLTKEAAYAAAVAPEFYEGVAQTEHPVGQYLKNVQTSSLKGLWEGIISGLLPKLTPAWFFTTFTSQSPDEAQIDQMKQAQAPFEQIWPQVTKLNLYDPMTLLACLDASDHLLFTPSSKHQAEKSDVRVIGQSEVSDPEKTRALMSALAKSACNS